MSQLLRGSLEHQSWLKPVWNRAVRLGPWCFTTQLQPPIIYVNTHEQQLLVMLVNIIQSLHAFCCYLWTRCYMHASAFANTHQHFFHRIRLSRKLTGRTGYLIKDLSVDDVHLRWQGYPSGEVMWIWALSWISLFFNDRAGPEGNQDVCIKLETNTCTLLCRGWCSQLGFDTAAVSLLEIVKKLRLLKDALAVLMDLRVIFSIGVAYYAMNNCPLGCDETKFFAYLEF